MGIFFSLSDILIHPFFHSYNQSFIYFTLSNMNSKKVSELLLVVYAMGYSSMIAFIAVQFLYRYWIMTNNRKAKLFEGWKIVLSVIYSLGCGFIYASSIYILGPVDESMKSYLREEMLKNYNASIDDISGFAVIGYLTENNSKTLLHGKICVATLLGIMSTQYTIMIYSGLQMHIKLKTQVDSLSISDKTLQRQLLKALIIQIASPSLFCCIPIIPILIGPFIFTNLSFPSGIFVSPFTIFPSLDSIILMIVVTEYRECLKNIWNMNFYSTYAPSISARNALSK
ncbi:unnamed protein product [Caenorhabditis angaria]|uniref:Seven TM Receptor n=1 Tax=Caenorhabditis angaria TaxID=860376 RepID=A0A9P1IYC2_9PELO|nr:unnamed protein product [Caenorhabditis angaria]